ncbi:TraR/DksA C4-type zinc finger protein [Cytobacillus praedii]|uniref:YteA family sporulation protein n=1 Tax=Cytobacillus praedii TaxID=1742358 RepID=A0A4R1AXU1_9BACI|nr:TraR/DksA C4-type zinc finger protein [Cytobacillus praedii]TCJ02802.1 yteA family sporulation protein [Cytobacillus praedii]
MLSKQELSEFKNKLHGLKQEINNRFEQNDHFGLNESFWKESMGELSNYDNHPGDAGTELFEREKDIALNEHLEDELKNINRALEAIENGTYGKCNVCSKDIPIERLEALPTTIFCIEHSQDQTTSHRRPVEEEIIGPPFKRFVKDEAEDESVGFDAEDSWQEVARWGTSESPSDMSNPSDDYNEVYMDSGENVGFVEDFENFVGVDMEGKNITVYPNAGHEALEEQLDDEDIMTSFGDLPAYEKDPYTSEYLEREKHREED